MSTPSIILLVLLLVSLLTNALLLFALRGALNEWERAKASVAFVEAGERVIHRAHDLTRALRRKDTRETKEASAELMIAVAQLELHLARHHPDATVH